MKKVSAAMWLYPKCYLRWREPQAFVRARAMHEERSEEKFLTRKRKASLSVLVAGVYILGRFFVGLDPTKTHLLPWPVAIPVCCLAGLGLVFWMPRLLHRYLRIAPSWVCVSRRSIYLRREPHGVHLPYTAILNCRITQESVNGNSLWLLMVTMRKGAVHFLAIDPGISIIELRRVLSQRAFPSSPGT